MGEPWLSIIGLNEDGLAGLSLASRALQPRTARAVAGNGQFAGYFEGNGYTLHHFCQINGRDLTMRIV